MLVQEFESSNLLLLTTILKLWIVTNSGKFKVFFLFFCRFLLAQFCWSNAKESTMNRSSLSADCLVPCTELGDLLVAKVFRPMWVTAERTATVLQGLR
jgi:hypothetical protein